MISFFRLGTLGRSGNILFQLAASNAQSLRLGTKLYSPDWLGRELFKLGENYRALPITSSSRYGWEILHRLCPRRFDSMSLAYDSRIETIRQGADLKGYFQSEKYFASFRSETLDFFNLKEGPFSDAVDEIGRAMGIGSAVSVHVRRGDYVASAETHPIVSADYYRAAFEQFPGSRFIVFSDNPQAAAEMLPGLELFDFEAYRRIAERHLLEDTNRYRSWIEFFLMSKASSNIIANSSFSWWAAYLNPAPDKVVVAPARWYGPAIASSPAEYEDLYPPSWRRL